MIPPRFPPFSPPEPPDDFPAKKRGDSVSEPQSKNSSSIEERKPRSYSEEPPLSIKIPKYDPHKPQKEFKKFQRSIAEACPKIPPLVLGEDVSLIPITRSQGSGIGKTFFAVQGQIPVKVIKPTYLANPRTHEPILQYGIPTYETGFRERIGSILSDQSEGFLFIPQAELRTISAKQFPFGTFPALGRPDSPIFCSVHDYIPLTRNLNTLSEEDQKFILENPSTTVQIRRITISDICLANTDGGPRNTLIDENGNSIRIDLGLILPALLEASVKSIGLYSSSTRSPFTEEEKTFILRLNFSDLKRQIQEEMPGISEDTLITLKATTETLKIGAELAMSPYEIGCLMFKGRYDRTSFLECCLKKAAAKSRPPEEVEAHIEALLRRSLPLCKQILEGHEHPPSSLGEDPRSPILREITTLASSSNTLYTTQERFGKFRRIDSNLSVPDSRSSKGSPPSFSTRSPPSASKAAATSTGALLSAPMESLQQILEEID